MALFIWKENFSVHIEEIDEQHKKFFDYVNGLHDAIQTGEGAKVLNGLLMDLFDYVRFHFRAEEEMLRILCYPGLKDQQKQHAYFESEINAMQAKYMNQSLVAASMLELLRDWFINHILDEDKKFGLYLDGIKTGTRKKKPALVGRHI